MDGAVHRRLAAPGNRQDLSGAAAHRFPAHGRRRSRGLRTQPRRHRAGDHLPRLATRSDLGSTQAQMALFDRLILADGVAKVVDLGHTAVRTVLYASSRRSTSSKQAARRAARDRHAVRRRSASGLRQGLRRSCGGDFPKHVVVPVFNEAILKGRAAARPISVHARSRGTAADSGAAAGAEGCMPSAPAIRSSISTASCRWRCRSARPSSCAPGPSATFLEFRELELRLLLEKLRASLKG